MIYQGLASSQIACAPPLSKVGVLANHNFFVGSQATAGVHAYG